MAPATTALKTRSASSGEERHVTTLLEVVNAVAELAHNDDEAVAVILHLLSSGQVKLLGEFTEQDFGFL
ncbi:MAG: hypothetical protein E4H03_04415 [Myxococcales bacterium]|nr:MAG: hypothetical protein E4H03_04415 [Myxococcales bacterium]